MAAPAPPPLGPPAPAPFMENILLAYNGQLNLRVAYTWNRNQIFAFLNSVVVTPGIFGIGAATAADLLSILNEIVGLSLPNGTEYRAAGITPDQHILQTINPAWANVIQPVQPPYKVSKFKLEKYYHDGVPYWCPFDLLGVFLSKMGPAPLGATKRNFYLPLTATFGRWCTQIGSRSPYMYNCCWISSPGTQETFFLSASLGGGQWDPVLVGNWQKRVRLARYHLVNGEPLTLQRWSFADSPTKREYGPRSQPFGNCAETFPFRHLLRGYGGNCANVHGISLQYKGVRPNTYQDGLSGAT